MDTISRAALVKAGELLDTVNREETGEIHTVNLTLDGRSGHALMTVQSELSGDIEFVVRGV